MRHLAAGIKQRGFCQPLLHQFQRHQPVVHPFEIRPAKTRQAHLRPTRVEAVEETAHQSLGIRVRFHRSVDKVHADDADGFLLFQVVLVQKAHVQHQVTGRTAWSGLETNAHPALAILLTAETAGGYGVGIYKKACVRSTLGREALVEQTVFVIQHMAQTILTHIALRGAINGIAHRHVVGAHAFGHCARRPAHPKKPSRHFLPRANLGKGAILATIKIYRLCLLRGGERGGGHQKNNPA